MIRILIPLILFFLAVVMVRRYIRNSSSAEQKKSRIITVALIIFAVVMILLALFQRMHWIGAFLAVVAPFARIALSTFLAYWKKRQQASAQKTTPSGTLSREDALQILGLKDPCSKEEIIEAHRKLMQKLHPDRGGNDFLAAQLNQAKEFLLKDL